MSEDAGGINNYAYIDDFNPYPSFQAGQKEAITEILELYDSGEKVIELNAPTASGKSLDLYVLGRVLSIQFKLDKVLYTTPLVTLVNQLEKEPQFSKMPVLKGRRNYPCGLYFEIMADECPFDTWGKAIKFCKHGDEDSRGDPCCDCSYHLDRERFMNSRFGATTFARYVVDPMCHGACAALLIDESAGLETALVNYSTMKLPDDTDIKNLRAYVVDYKQQLDEEIGSLDEEIKVLQEEFYELDSTKQHQSRGKAVLDQIKQLNKTKTHDERESRKCEKVIYHIDNNHKYIIDKGYHFRLLEGKSEFERLIKNLDLVILASGTPTSAIYADNFKSVRVQHPIPLDRRTIYYCPVGSMNYKDREITAPKIAYAIEKLHAKYHKKTMVHCGAYTIAKMLYDRLSNAAKDITILQTNPDERELYKNMFMGSEGEQIFLSIRFVEGLNLKGPDYPMNIIAKIPFENIKDEYVSQRNQHDNYLRYNTFAAVEVMQAAGRCTRTPTDFSETWILDASWRTLLNRNRKKFEPWFLAALKEGKI